MKNKTNAIHFSPIACYSNNYSDSICNSKHKTAKIMQSAIKYIET